MNIKGFEFKKLEVIEKLNQLINELSKTIFEVDGNNIIDVDLDYTIDIKESNHKKCIKNINIKIQYEEDLK